MDNTVSCDGVGMSYAFMEPQRKRRELFTSEEYAKAQTIEEAYWMARQETAWFAVLGIIC